MQDEYVTGEGERDWVVGELLVGRGSRRCIEILC